MKPLRQYIRQILLTEGMKTPIDLPEDAYVWIADQGSRFYVIVDAPSWHSSAKLSLRKYPHGCSGAWEVVKAVAPSGWGPLLYDIAMEYVGGEGIMCDRSSVSKEAAHIWDFYLNSRPDVKAAQLDYNRQPFITPEDESDDCPGNTFTKHDHDEIEKAEPESYGHFYPTRWPAQQKPWKDHWSTKKYIKLGGTPIIDQLNDMNILEYK